MRCCFYATFLRIHGTKHFETQFVCAVRLQNVTIDAFCLRAQEKLIASTFHLRDLNQRIMMQFFMEITQITSCIIWIYMLRRTFSVRTVYCILKCVWNAFSMNYLGEIPSYTCILEICFSFHFISFLFLFTIFVSWQISSSFLHRTFRFLLCKGPRKPMRNHMSLTSTISRRYPSKRYCQQTMTGR